MKKIFIHPLFLIYTIILIMSGQVASVVAYFIAVLIHEFAHYFIAKKLGYKLNKLLLMPYGACLNYEDTEFVDNDEIYIALAGPFINLIITIVIVAFWWILPYSYYYTFTFCLSNFVIFLFNILPCFPLDGGRVLIALLNKKLKRNKCIKIAIIFNIIIVIIFLLIFIFGIINNIINLNLIIISLFLLGGILMPNKNYSYNYSIYENVKKTFKNKRYKVNLICVDYSIQLYKIGKLLNKNKFNIIYAIYENKNVKIINEIYLFKLIYKYPPLTKLNDIFEMFI